MQLFKCVCYLQGVIDDIVTGSGEMSLMLYCVCLFVNGDLFGVSPIIYKNHNISLLPSILKVVTFACMP